MELKYNLCCAYTVNGPPDGGLGRYPQMIHNVWLFLPLYLDQVHLPKLEGSDPLPTTLCAALLILNRDTPPYCLGLIGVLVVLES